MSRDEATQCQIDAADPTGNTWLSANAGSGKTRVLTDRVARLLLEDVPPQNILCLTYTKAAASEMQNRLFKRLGAWAMLDDSALESELDVLGVTEAPDLRKARRLFARAIETPGGLKIQTIHAFCATILRRFPMEAGVSPDFKEMDDRTAQLLQEEIVEEMAAGTPRPLVEGLAQHYTGAELDKLTSEIVGNRLHFLEPVDRETVWSWLNLPPALDRETVLAETLAPGDGAMLAVLLPILRTGSKTEITAADKLSSINPDALAFGDLEVLESVFLTGKSAASPFSAKIGSFPTKGTRAGSAAHLTDALDGLMARVEGMRDRRLALLTAERTRALHAFAHPFVRAYEERKAMNGWLDFDDLILRASALLNTSDVAQWVLYRLDGGIDHILVDEAQDTSPSQWRVIDSLAREFMSGEGAHADKDWSIFVVGDPKQSIYSFQGADPAEFAKMRNRFREGLGQMDRPLQQMPLEYSFRSAPAILTAVDSTLSEAGGLGDAAPNHKAFHAMRPGRVDLWPAIEPVKPDELRPWDDPLDVAAPTDHSVMLAESIAEEIGRMIREEKVPVTDGAAGGFRPVTAGDILILVQRRSDLFKHIIRACKTRGLPIAGADRLRIGGEMAVRDLTALLAFLATQEDDLSLAAVLRSPLFGLSEDALFRLANPRPDHQYLWRALWASEHRDVVEVLQDLRERADYLRPYDLIDRVLTRHDGRRLLLGRLGAEAEDGIDAMLAQALAYERMEVPSLTGFLTWLDTEDVEIKRQMDAKAREIRVMTVHGAKGLESPVVILPDTAKRDLRGRGDLVANAGKLIWKPRADDMPQSLTGLNEDAKEREREERMRLLYVAMTRAESWLIVAGAGDMGKEAADSWHGLVRHGVSALDAAPRGFPSGVGGLRYQDGVWPEPETQDVEDVAEQEPDPPDWTERAAPIREAPPRPLSPSKLEGAKSVAGALESASEADNDAAKRRGRQIHRLLEFLPDYPQAEWSHHATALLAFGEDAADYAEVAALLDEVSRVLTTPALAPLFSADALAEVEVSAPAGPDGVRIHGIIDRLIIEPGRICAIDFKSNQTVPGSPEDIPEGILRQLGAYEVALAPLYPDREITSAVLWTRSATLMDVPPGVAIRTFRSLDGMKRDT
ncbi:double-strand break repair helicase AddA [Maritimibacter sp. UBA3975]|uniref:double-strand break repair helicase AddA n=1 Tax=Maritimibacter sp. UBA3975 TaxID=1946833 RepID=UPI000C09496D|nr:double-strand break repair helicase AddA [Maritimibacter sp. UBA3975]MAM63410.1 double-strand break repair helicase AddA [Maritimibacter sp.]|tara:strand:- start:65937 stop:69329 length:3393 start_codon:yes stop_codon:yes gene_type:complete